MTTGIAVFAIGVLVVVCLFLVGAAVLDRLRAQRVEQDLPDRVDTAAELKDRESHEHPDHLEHPDRPER